MSCHELLASRVLREMEDMKAECLAWTAGDLQKRDPLAMEELVSSLWSEMGFSCSVTPASRDRGIDVLAVDDRIPPRCVAIQVKHYRSGSSVSAPEIQQYASLRQRPDIDDTVVVSTSGFTREALREAADMRVELVDGIRLIDLLAQHSVPKSFVAESSGQSHRKLPASAHEPGSKPRIGAMLPST